MLEKSTDVDTRLMTERVEAHNCWQNLGQEAQQYLSSLPGSVVTNSHMVNLVLGDRAMPTPGPVTFLNPYSLVGCLCWAQLRHVAFAVEPNRPLLRKSREAIISGSEK